MQLPHHVIRIMPMRYGLKLGDLVVHSIQSCSRRLGMENSDMIRGHSGDESIESPALELRSEPSL